jgi:hypothetical protein
VQNTCQTIASNEFSFDPTATSTLTTNRKQLAHATSRNFRESIETSEHLSSMNTYDAFAIQEKQDTIPEEKQQPPKLLGSTRYQYLGTILSKNLGCSPSDARRSSGHQHQLVCERLGHELRMSDINIQKQAIQQNSQLQCIILTELCCENE